MKLFSLGLLFLFSLNMYATGPVGKQITITYEGKPIAVVNRDDFSVPFLDETLMKKESYNQLEYDIANKVNQPPINASLTKTKEIMNGKTGHKLNKSEFYRLFHLRYVENTSTEMEVPLIIVYPKVDSELLANISHQQIGRYMTYFNVRNKERSHNIRLASEAINNFVLFPSETFSFNEVVGKRTKDKGYMPAPIIVKGELSEGVGGGICQVSSTLFNAIDKAGLEVIQRYSHSRKVGYVPPRRDATVSWYGPDFKFKNNQNEPILIQSNVYGGSLLISVYSSDTIKNQERSVPKAPKSIPEEIIVDGVDSFH